MYIVAIIYERSLARLVADQDIGNKITRNDGVNAYGYLIGQELQVDRE